MSGCAICVYDLYDDAMSTYKDKCRTVCDELRARGADEDIWPAELRSFSTGRGLEALPQEVKVDPVKAAFEKMERELQGRRAAQGKETMGSVEGAETPRPELGSVGRDRGMDDIYINIGRI